MSLANDGVGAVLSPLCDDDGRARRPPATRPLRTPPTSRQTQRRLSVMDMTSATALSTEAAPRRTMPIPCLERGKASLLVRAAREATPFPASQHVASPSDGAPSPRPSARSLGPRRARSRAPPRCPGHRRIVIGDGSAVLLCFLVPRPPLTAREGRGRLAGSVHRCRPRGRRLAGPHRRENERDGAQAGLKACSDARRKSILAQTDAWAAPRKQRISKTVRNPLRPLRPCRPATGQNGGVLVGRWH